MYSGCEHSLRQKRFPHVGMEGLRETDRPIFRLMGLQYGQNDPGNCQRGGVNGVRKLLPPAHFARNAQPSSLVVGAV